jgi:Fic family protein
MNKEVSTFHAGKFVFNADYNGSFSALFEASSVLSLSGRLPVIHEQPAAAVSEKESLHATSALSGSSLTYTEVGNIISQNAEVFAGDPHAIRVFNLLEAFGFIRSQKKTDKFIIDDKLVTDIHSVLEKRVSEEPAVYRNRPVGYFEKACTSKFSPPETKLDINLLMKSYYEWINSPEIIAKGLIIRACLAHLYLVKIYPFTESVGILARIIESLVYKASGAAQVSYLLSAAYLKSGSYYEIIEKFFEDNDPAPFIEFVCETVTGALAEAQENSFKVINKVMFDKYIETLLENRAINIRLFELVKILKHKSCFNVQELQLMNEFTSIYGKVSRTTVKRDIAKLIELGLLTEKEEDVYELDTEILLR